MSQTAAIICITVCRAENKAEIHTLSITQHQLECLTRQHPDLSLVQWAKAEIEQGVDTAVKNQVIDTPEHRRECSADRYFNS